MADGISKGDKLNIVVSIGLCIASVVVIWLLTPKQNSNPATVATDPTVPTLGSLGGTTVGGVYSPDYNNYNIPAYNVTPYIPPPNQQLLPTPSNDCGCNGGNQGGGCPQTVNNMTTTNMFNALLWYGLESGAGNSSSAGNTAYG